MPKRTPGKIATTYHCESVSISMVIPEAQFSRKAFTDNFPALGELKLDANTKGVAGPLLFKEDPSLAVDAVIEYHDHKEGDKHYWLVLRGSTQRKAKVEKNWPTVEQFEQALELATSSAPIEARITGRHRFSATDWKGVLELPIPLPVKSEDVKAQLTGVQVTYETASGRGVVLFAVKDTVLSASTEFGLVEPSRPGYLLSVIDRSCSSAKRVVNEVAKQKQDA